MRSKQHFIGILVFLAVSGFAYFVVWDRLAQAYGNFRQMEEAREEAASLQWLITNQSSLSQAFSAYKSANNSLFEFVPAKFSESDPLMALYVAANNNGMELMGVDIKKPVPVFFI